MTTNRLLHLMIAVILLKSTSRLLHHCSRFRKRRRRQNFFSLRCSISSFHYIFIFWPKFLSLYIKTTRLIWVGWLIFICDIGLNKLHNNIQPSREFQTWPSTRPQNTTDIRKSPENIKSSKENAYAKVIENSLT